jgi:hypothetical protein
MTNPRVGGDSLNGRPDPEEFFRGTVDAWVQRAQAEGQLDLNPVAQCRVCKDPIVRGLVNHMIANGARSPDILHALEAHNLKLQSDGNPSITKTSIYNHKTRHFNVQAPAAALFRQIQEKNQIGDWEEGVGTILNVMSYYETMMVKGYETMTNPETAITPREGAEAAHKLHEIARQDEGAYEAASMRAEMGRVIEVVRQFVPPDKWPEVQAILRGEGSPRVQPQAVESVRVVEIDDKPDEDGN